MRLRLTALLLAPVVALLTAAGLLAPAGASTGGTVDSANRYSSVGFLLSYTDGGLYSCSGALVSPTVVLTAAHCTDGVDGKIAVSFDWDIDQASPLSAPRAADPAAGYTAADIATDPRFRSGTGEVHPEYSDFTDMDNWNDVGVVVLDTPVTGLAPMEIAPVGTLDAIAKSQLSKTLFRAVGYGTEVRKPESGPQKPTPMSYPIVRRYVDMPGQKLTPQILQTNGNEKDNRGTGGTCFGDSGGPVILNGQIVGVTSYGYTDNCRYLGGYQRVDIDVAQDWLAQFGL